MSFYPSIKDFDLCQIIRMNIQDHKGIIVELSSHKTVDQIFPFPSMFQEEKSCSK